VRLVLDTFPETIRIRVQDFGVGIPPNSEDQVFSRFSQVDSSDKRTAGGTGLGMYISKMIVEKHGGKIGYVSDLGQGTTFSIELDRII